MNFLFISPNFPDICWNYCDRLKRDGATVLGIGDTPYDQVAAPLKAALTEYFWLPDLEDYDAVLRAAAFLTYKHGKIDWVESNNEHWLGLDAHLREDFNVATGAHSAQVAQWQSKAEQKPLYAQAGVPTARQTPLTNFDDVRWFIGEVGDYPVFAKPEVGVGAQGAQPLTCNRDLRYLLAAHGSVPYVVEQMVEGDIVAYDAILDSHCEPLFENQEEFPPSMAKVREGRLDIAYWSCPGVDERLRELGRAAARSFGLASRWVHMEFFRLSHDTPGLGRTGDYVGLEVNARPTGGYSPDMMCVAHSLDVYQVWADMVCFDESHVAPGEDGHFFCVHASRRDGVAYVHGDDEVRGRFGEAIVSARRMPAGLSDEVGDFAYVARFRTRDQVDEFVTFVQERVAEPVPDSEAIAEG